MTAPPRTVNYSTRNLRTDLLDRLRVLAALGHTSIETVLNHALARGLDVLDAERKAARREATR